GRKHRRKNVAEAAAVPELSADREVLHAFRVEVDADFGGRGVDDRGVGGDGDGLLERGRFHFRIDYGFLVQHELNRTTNVLGEAACFDGHFIASDAEGGKSESAFALGDAGSASVGFEVS